MNPFTTVIALDEEHLEEFKVSYWTWRRFRREIWQNPLLILIDPARSYGWWKRELGFLLHRDQRLVCVNSSLGALSHREMMLSAFVLQAPLFVETSWFIKLDVDLLASKDDISWYSDTQSTVNYVFSAHKWSYTRPSWMLERIQSWADSHPYLSRFPPLILPAAEKNKIRCNRIISWVFSCSTSWARQVSGLVSGSLPCPSQDTYHWYIAARTGTPYKAYNALRKGWHHLRYKKLCRKAKEILEQK